MHINKIKFKIQIMYYARHHKKIAGIFSTFFVVRIYEFYIKYCQGYCLDYSIVKSPFLKIAVSSGMW